MTSRSLAELKDESKLVSMITLIFLKFHPLPIFHASDPHRLSRSHSPSITCVRLAAILCCGGGGVGPNRCTLHVMLSSTKMVKKKAPIFVPFKPILVSSGSTYDLDRANLLADVVTQIIVFHHLSLSSPSTFQVRCVYIF